MKRGLRSVFLSLVLLLSGCSAMDLLSLGSGGGPSLEVDTTLGDKNQEVQVGDKAESITNVQEVPMEFMLLMVLGWLLPSPGEMWRGFVGVLPFGNKRRGS